MRNTFQLLQNGLITMKNHQFNSSLTNQKLKPTKKLKPSLHIKPITTMNHQLNPTLNMSQLQSTGTHTTMLLLFNFSLTNQVPKPINLLPLHPPITPTTTTVSALKNIVNSNQLQSNGKLTTNYLPCNSTHSSHLPTLTLKSRIKNSLHSLTITPKKLELNNTIHTFHLQFHGLNSTMNQLLNSTLTSQPLNNTPLKTNHLHTSLTTIKT
jgi:hypothetical protein